MSILVIVESPSKCKKIEQYLNTYNNNYKCIASYGHIRELAGIESININNNFAPTFIECVSKKEQIKKIKKAIKEAEEVILASDDDREGEAIAWHICQVFNLPVETTKRIIFHEITESAIHRSIENPILVNMAIVNAQMARQVLDILVGYKLSPILWKNVKDGLSAGRCQTPALRLIYDNQREIDETPGKKSYTITTYFTNKNIPFILNHEETDEEKLKLFLQESVKHQHVYKDFSLKNKTRSAPEPFSTSSLQQTCSNELHLSPKETMSICQTLYEEGYITYPRTDNRSYSNEFMVTVGKYITKKYGKEYMATEYMATENMATENKNKNKNKKETENAHEAIRVTDLEETSGKEKENRVYKLIKRRTLESCMAAATVSVLSAVISAPYDNEYHYSTEHVIFAGWKIVENKIELSKNYSYLQSLKREMVLPYQKIKAIFQLKELKTHLTEARLVQLLEEKGIGRPSTFSSLIEKIQERKYVRKDNVMGKLISCTDYEMEKDQLIKITSEKEFGNEKNKLIIQPVGILALEFLIKHFDTIFQYTYTKNMEDELDAVARGEKVWYDICRSCNEHLSITNLDKGKEIIRIDEEHVFMIGRYGPVIKYTPLSASRPSSAAVTSAAVTSAAVTSAAVTSAAVTSASRPSSAKKTVTKKKESEVSFKAVRKDIDLNKLRRGEYTIDEIVDNDIALSIGTYKDKPVYIKVGKFGKYLEWNNLSKSLKHFKQRPADITLDDVYDTLFDMENEEAVILRIINDDASIRKGKYGDYIFYKNKKMNKPRFLKLESFTGDYINCDIIKLQEWFTDTFKI